MTELPNNSNIQLLVQQNIPQNYINMSLREIIDVTFQNILQNIPENKRTEIVGNMSREIIDIICFKYFIKTPLF